MNISVLQIWTNKETLMYSFLNYGINKKKKCNHFLTMKRKEKKNVLVFQISSQDLPTKISLSTVSIKSVDFTLNCIVVDGISLFNLYHSYI
jgi:tRNA (Thr-GGU) A37 N-methylase